MIKLLSLRQLKPGDVVMVLDPRDDFRPWPEKFTVHEIYHESFGDIWTTAATFLSSDGRSGVTIIQTPASLADVLLAVFGGALR